jgi:hypothetical protein
MARSEIEYLLELSNRWQTASANLGEVTKWA